ncbi:MAG: MerR family transcriptional regulator [Gemmatimonadales bacterium]
MTLPDDKRHPIQVVVRRTALTADVLRAWERRYGAVEPERSPSGRRLYSDDDIERLRLLKRAADAGRSIGQIASHDTEALAAMVRDDEVQEAEAPHLEPAGPDDAAARQLVAEAMEAVGAMDVARLDAALRRDSVEMSELEFTQHVLAPLLHQIGDQWHAGTLSVAHEHVASAVTRRVVGDMLADSPGREAMPLIVVATPSGERHEFGALMAAATAAAAGWRVVYLGPDIPADSIAVAAERHAPRLVALSVVNAPPALEEVAELRRRLPKDTTLVLGGRGFGGDATAEGVVYLADLKSFRAYLGTVASGRAG